MWKAKNLPKHWYCKKRTSFRTKEEVGEKMKTEIIIATILALSLVSGYYQVYSGESIVVNISELDSFA